MFFESVKGLKAVPADDMIAVTEVRMGYMVLRYTACLHMHCFDDFWEVLPLT